MDNEINYIIFSIIQHVQNKVVSQSSYRENLYLAPLATC